nr:unnamed protein product [Trichobilharzia regenti]
MKLEADGKKSFVETDMYRRRCADEPEIFFKPCPINDKNKPRGCGKLTTYVKEPVSKGRTREVTLMRRFCATEGAEPEEVKCVNRHSEGGFSEICICGSDNCNSAPQLSMKSTSFTYFFLFTFPYIYYLLSN